MHEYLFMVMEGHLQHASQPSRRWSGPKWRQVNVEESGIEVRPATKCAEMLFRVAGSRVQIVTAPGRTAELVAQSSSTKLGYCPGRACPGGFPTFTYSSCNLYQLAYQLARNPDPSELRLQAEARGLLRHGPHCSLS